MQHHFYQIWMNKIKCKITKLEDEGMIHIMTLSHWLYSMDKNFNGSAIIKHSDNKKLTGPSEKLYSKILKYASHEIIINKDAEKEEAQKLSQDYSFKYHQN